MMSDCAQHLAVIELEDRTSREGRDFWTEIKHGIQEEFQHFWCQFVEPSPEGGKTIYSCIFLTHTEYIKDIISDISSKISYDLIPNRGDECVEHYHAMFGKVTSLSETATMRLNLARKLEEEALLDNKISALTWQAKITPIEVSGIIKQKVTFIVNKKSFNTDYVSEIITRFKEKGMKLFDNEDRRYMPLARQ